MDLVIENVLKRLFALREGNFLKRLGQSQDLAQQLTVFGFIEQVENVSVFDDMSKTETLEDFLLERSNILRDFAGTISTECQHTLNDVTMLMKPGIESEFGSFEIDGADNSPQGFGPSIYVGTVSWIFKSLAKEEYLRLETDCNPPRVYDALTKILEAGHFPCGWEQMPNRGKLWIY